MRIVIDGRMIGWPGIGRYTKHLLSELAKLDSQNSYQVLLKGDDFRDFQSPGANFAKVRANIEPYSLAEQIKLAGIVKQLKPDLVHWLGPNQPVRYHGPHVTTIYDLTLLKFKNVRRSRWRYELKYQAFRWVFNKAVKSAVHLFTISNYVKQELLQQYKIPASRITATLLAAEHIQAAPIALERLKINRPYLLYVGYAFPHKNLERLLEAFKQVRNERPNLQLVLAGKSNFFYQQLKGKVQELGLGTAVHFTGYVSDGELVTLYRRAMAFVLPSLSEGFGLTALEAMIQGTPVIAAKAGSLPEVCGQAAVYFDPLNTTDIAKTINGILADKGLLAKMSSAGKQQAQQFSWSKMAKATLAVYNRVLK